jgi:hypothetical protein
VVTAHRYVGQDRWYLRVDRFFRYPLDTIGQRMLDGAGLRDGETVPDGLYDELRKGGHLRRLPDWRQPWLLPPEPHA